MRVWILSFVSALLAWTGAAVAAPIAVVEIGRAHV